MISLATRNALLKQPKLLYWFAVFFVLEGLILTATVSFPGQHAPRGAGRRHATSRFCRLPRLHPIPSGRHPQNSGLDSPPRCDKRCSENGIANGRQANLSV